MKLLVHLDFYTRVVGKFAVVAEKEQSTLYGYVELNL